jgi:SdpC family antimicrobial peptide
MHASLRRHVRRPFVLALIAVLMLSLFQSSGFAARPASPPRPISGEELFRGILLADGPVADMLPEIRDQIRPMLVVNAEPRLRRAIVFFQDELIEALGRRDPAFFDDFAAAMRSGDRLRLQRTLVGAGHATVAALRESPAIRAVGRDLKADPARQRALYQALRSEPGLEALSDADLEAAVASMAALAVEPVDEEPVESPDPDSSIVAVLVAVAAVAGAITVAVASSYAGAINVVLAVNFYVAVVATYQVYVTRSPTIVPDGTTLLQEQLVDSIATTFGS